MATSPVSPAISFPASASDAVSRATSPRAELRSLVRRATRFRLCRSASLTELSVLVVRRSSFRARLTVASPSVNRARPSCSSAIAVLAPSRAASAFARAGVRFRLGDDGPPLRFVEGEHRVPDETAGRRDQRHDHDARSRGSGVARGRQGRGCRAPGRSNSLMATMSSAREGRCRSVRHRPAGASRSGRRGHRHERAEPSGLVAETRNSTRRRRRQPCRKGTTERPATKPPAERNVVAAAPSATPSRLPPMSARPHSNVTIPKTDVPAAGPAERPGHAVEAGRFTARVPRRRRASGAVALPGHDPLRFQGSQLHMPSTFDDSVLPATSVFCLLTMPEAGRAETPSELRFPVKNSACGAIELFLYTAGTRALPGSPSIQGARNHDKGTGTPSGSDVRTRFEGCGGLNGPARSAERRWE